jgi:hypothetical protein
VARPFYQVSGPAWPEYRVTWQHCLVRGHRVHSEKLDNPHCTDSPFVLSLHANRSSTYIKMAPYLIYKFRMIRMLDIQGVPGGKVDILGGHSIGHCEQKTVVIKMTNIQGGPMRKGQYSGRS